MITNVSPNSTEQHLVAGLRAGDKGAFGDLYDKYAPLLMGIIARITGEGKAAEDTLQQTFLGIWARRAEYDANKERLFIWMMRLAKEAAMSAQQKNAQATDKIDTDDENLHKHVLEMVYFNVHDLPEITARLNMTEDAIKSTLKCALYRIKTEGGHE